MAKKLTTLFLLTLISTSLFASGHGMNGLGMVFGILIGIFIYAILFIILTILIAINVGLPGKNRSIVYTIIFSFFTVVFLYLFFSTVRIFSTGLFELSSYVICGGAFFIILITLNIIFLILAFNKLNKKKESEITSNR